MRYYYDARNRILLARKLLPARWRAVSHVYNLTFALLRIVKVLRSRRPEVAPALAVLWASTRGLIFHVAFALLLGGAFLLASWHYALNLEEKW